MCTRAYQQFEECSKARPCTSTGFRLYFSRYERQKQDFRLLLEAIVKGKPISNGPLIMVDRRYFTEIIVSEAYFANMAYNLTLDVDLL